MWQYDPVMLYGKRVAIAWRGRICKQSLESTSKLTGWHCNLKPDHYVFEDTLYNTATDYFFTASAISNNKDGHNTNTHSI